MELYEVIPSHVPRPRPASLRILGMGLRTRLGHSHLVSCNNIMATKQELVVGNSHSTNFHHNLFLITFEALHEFFFSCWFIQLCLQVYEGEYLADKKHGRGTYTWLSEARFTGQFESDQKEGFGVYISPDGEKFEVRLEERDIQLCTCTFP